MKAIIAMNDAKAFVSAALGSPENEVIISDSYFNNDIWIIAGNAVPTNRVGGAPHWFTIMASTASDGEHVEVTDFHVTSEDDTLEVMERMRKNK